MNTAKAIIPSFTLDVDALLLKADGEGMTFPSSLSGIGYATDASGRILILDKHQFFMATAEDWQVIIEELKYFLDEAERWRRS